MSNSSKAPKAATAAPKTSPAKKRVASVLESVKNLNPEDVLNEITKLQLGVQTQLAGLGTNVTNQIEKMRDLDEAIAEKESRLTELHEIEKEALAIDAMREKHAAEEAAFEKKMADASAQWQEDESERKKRWQREDEERKYAVEQRVKRGDEEFAASVQERKRVEGLRQQDLQRTWDEKTAELDKRQQELTDLRARVAQFEEEKKKDIAKEVAIESNRLKRDNDHAMALVQKDSQAAAQLAAARETSLNSQIKSLNDQLAQLAKDLEKTRLDAKEVTTEALKSASSRDALGAVQQMSANAGQKK